eukprot:IDg7535t1
MFPDEKKFHLDGSEGSTTARLNNLRFHVSDPTKGIDLLDWTSIRPDINSIENLWGVLIRDIYAGSKQYQNINDLKQAIWRAQS